MVMDNPNFYPSNALRRMTILSLLHSRPSGVRTLNHGPSALRTTRRPYKRLGGCGLIGRAGKINELAESAGIDEPIRETYYVGN